MRLATAFLISLVLPAARANGQGVQTGFLDRSVTVSGTAYHYEIYVPASYSTAQQWPVILFLHGAGERGGDGLLQTSNALGAAIRRSPSAYPAIVIFPQTPPVDSSWVGPSSEIAIAALDQTLAEFRTDPDRVYLTGLSIGGNGTWYVAYHHPDRFAAIAPIGGFVTPFPRRPYYRFAVPADSGDPYQALARGLGKMPTWIFHGEIDGTIPVAQSRQAAEAIRQAGGDVRYTEFLGMDHNVWDAVYASPQFLNWLFAQRRKR
jgi:predicted peptidase